MTSIQQTIATHTDSQTPIFLFSSHPLSELRKSKPILWLGGVHGDEPEGVELAERTLEWLKSNNRLNLCPWLLLPCLNPDGYKKNQRVNGNGVDLNRNYPSLNWSSDAKAERYFPGASAGSEPEIQMMMSLIQNYEPRLIVHCHSWKPCIVATGPWAHRDAQRLSEASGYEVVETIGYDTPGSLSSYAWHDLKIPVICIEEQEGVSLESVWTRFKMGVEQIFTDLSLRNEI